MEEFAGSIQKVINFGCSVQEIDQDWAIEGISYDYSYEVFALKGILKTEQVTVIDKKEEFILNLSSLLKQLADARPDCFDRDPRWLEFFALDLTQYSPSLASNHFDFGYSARVLLNIYGKGKEEQGEIATRQAIREISRVIKLGGLMVSRESDVERSYPSIYKQMFQETGFSILKNHTVKGVGEHIIYQKSEELPRIK